MLYLDKMVKIEDVVFWITILAIIAIALWLLSGSPPETNALISIALFVAVSELMLWKFLFKIDKNTSVRFVKVKGDFNIIKKDIRDIKENIININKKLK